MEIGHNTSWVFLIAIGFCFLICKLPRMGKEFSGVFPVFPSFPALVGALWARITKNTDWSTGSLARPFDRSLVPLTR